MYGRMAARPYISTHSKQHLLILLIPPDARHDIGAGDTFNERRKHDFAAV
jgi:hypothetical protein